MIYSVDDINKLRVAAVHFSLEAPTEFWNLPAEQMIKICNGIGPAGWFKFVREKLTQLAGDYAVVAAIHDVQQEFKIGTNKAASRIFLHNSLKVWALRHGIKGFMILSAWVEIALSLAAFLALYFWGDKYWEASKNDDPQ